MGLLQNNYFRFGTTLILAALYSLLRETHISTFVKPLPILFWFIVVLASPKRVGGWWVLLSLFCAGIGDVLLDLGPDWLGVATVPFLGSTLVLAWAFHIGGRSARVKIHWSKELLLLSPILGWAIAFHLFMAPLMGEAARIGAVLMGLSTLLIWRALAAVVFAPPFERPRLYRVIGFLGACGIVANYVLYAVNIGLHPVPRDLVIQLYYWGTAFAAWSFLLPSKEMSARRSET